MICIAKLHQEDVILLSLISAIAFPVSSKESIDLLDLNFALEVTKAAAALTAIYCDIIP